LVLCRSGMLFGVSSRQSSMCVQCPRMTLSFEHLPCCGSFEWPGFNLEQQEGAQRMAFIGEEFDTLSSTRPAIQFEGERIGNYDYIGSVLLTQLSEGEWMNSGDQSSIERSAEEGATIPKSSRQFRSANHLFSILAGVLQRYGAYALDQ